MGSLLWFESRWIVSEKLDCAGRAGRESTRTSEERYAILATVEAEEAFVMLVAAQKKTTVSTALDSESALEVWHPLAPTFNVFLARY